MVHPYLKNLLGVCLLFSMWMCLPAEGTAQQRLYIRGFVTDQTDGQPLPGANVVVENLASNEQRVAVSNDDGFYQVVPLDPGAYAMRVSFVGYAPYRDTVDVANDKPQIVNVALVPVDYELEGVTVEAPAGAAELEGGRQTIRPADIERIPTPGPGGDIASYLQSLPGVTSLGDRGGQLYVRGGTPSQNLILVDDIPVYQPFHVVGFFSAIPQDLVSSADFYAGGFGAEYAGRLSAVLDVRTRPGNNKAWTGQVGASPFLTSVRVEGPLRQGSSSVIASFRSSVLEQLGSSYLGEETPLYFNDAFFKIHEANTNGLCSITALRTYDRGRINPNDSRTFKWSNIALGGRCLSVGPVSATSFDVTSSFSYYSNEVSTPDADERTADAWSIRTDIDIATPYSWGELSGGIRLRGSRYAYTLNEQFMGLDDANEFFLTFGGHLGVGLDIGDKLTVEPSVAATLPIQYGLEFEPRMRISYRPWGDEDRELFLAGGWYRQLITGLTDERDVGSVFTAWVPGPNEGGSSHAVHALMGWRHRLTNGFTTSLEGYAKQVFDHPVPLVSGVATFTRAIVLADAEIYGADARVEWQNGRYYAFVGYGWSITEYQAAEESLGTWFGEPVQAYNPAHDLRHQLSTLFSAELPWFTADVRWSYGSGLPYTQLVGFDTALLLRGLVDRPDRDTGRIRLLFEEPYGARLPAYHRLDVSAERVFDLARSTQLTVEVGAINAYNRENLFYLDLVNLERVDQLPIIPYLSLVVDLR